MMKSLGLLGRGILIWLIPFVVSFFFYTPDQELSTSYALFKSVMVVALTLTTLAVNWIGSPRGSHPLMLAIIYTGVSIVLDLVVLLPMAALTPAAYSEQILLLYVIIFAITWTTQAARQQTALPRIAAAA